MKQTRDLALLLLAAVLVVPVSWAQDTDDEGRGVARISVLNGDVSVRRGDGDDLIAAAINAPLVVPDTLYTGSASRAEVQLDWANLVRLSSNAEVKFSELDYQRFQIQVARGAVTYSVLRDSKADVDLATPNVSVRPLSKGRYRVTVHDDGTTEVTVRSGEAEIYTPQGVEYLKSGKSMLVRGTLGSPEFQIASAPPKDEWDHWNEQRDKELKRSVSYNYVSPSVYGAEDLDGYGSWEHDPGYGWVWAPRVSAGWAPYRYGRWSWVDWYGWSWVSYDPWGWAPYHYGRWYNRPGGGWCWWPGGIGVRHHWSPGLVAFFGWGSHSGFSAGISIGFGHVGWVPLAPYERYHRWYGHGYYGGQRGGNNRTYIDNSVNITNIYQNARHRNGVTAVDGREFGRGHVRNTYRGDSATLRNANLVRGQLPVVPQQESRRFASRDVNRSTVVSSRTNGGTAYTRRTANQTSRVSFADQQRGVERVVERTSGRGGTTRAGQTEATGGAAATRSSRNSAVAGQGNRASGATRSASPSGNRGAAASSSGLTPRSASDANQQSGWKRAPDSGSSRTQRSTGGSSPGWTSFGQPTQTQRTARGSGNSSAASQNQSSADRSAGRSAAPAASRSSRGNSGGWTRFGEPGGSPAATSRSGSRASGSGSASPSGAVRRSNSGSTPSATRRDSGSSSRSATPASVYGGARSAPSSSQSSGSVGRSSGSSARSSASRDSIRVRPPIVQPRSAPSSSPRVYEGSSGSRSSGSVGRSNRSSGGYSPPSRSAPSPSRSSGPSMRSAPSPSRPSPSGSGASSGGRSGGSSGRSSSDGRSGRGGRR